MLTVFRHAEPAAAAGRAGGGRRGPWWRRHDRGPFPVTISASGDPATPAAVCIDGIVCGAPARSSIVVDWTAASGNAGVTAFATGADGTERVRLLTADLESSTFPITVRAKVMSAPDSYLGEPVVIDQALAETLARYPASSV